MTECRSGVIHFGSKEPLIWFTSSSLRARVSSYNFLSRKNYWCCCAICADVALFAISGSAGFGGIGTVGRFVSVVQLVSVWVRNT